MADIVFDQVPNQSGGYPSDTDYIFFGQPNQSQRMADDFRLDEAAGITAVVYFGFFYDSFYAPENETVRIRFLGSRESDGLPDESAVHFEHSFQNPSRQETGEYVSGGDNPPEYRYTIGFASPVAVAADAKYWLEVVQLGNPESDFAWETAYTTSPLDRIAGNNAVHPNWAYAVPRASLAFQLLIPEPTTNCLSILGILIFHRRRGRHRVRARSG